MAKQVVLLDDLSGEVIDKDLGGGTLRFSVEDKRYTIDLGTKNTEAFYKAIQKYIDAAAEEVDAPRRGRSSSSSSPSTRASSGSGRSKEELANIREWLKSNGYEVNDRGRIKGELLDAYDDAHKS